MQIVAAQSRPQLEQAKNLFRRYAESLDFGLGFQDFERELAEFPGEYAAPRGCILLALVEGRVLGCVALRPRGPETCEMKRLYVLPEARGEGVGRALAEAVVARARRLGYDRMWLDTVAGMEPAIALYRSLGFSEIPPYYHNPIEGATFMELVLK